LLVKIVENRNEFGENYSALAKSRCQIIFQAAMQIHPKLCDD